jgi:RimJ/RimL family protein N-acetyltransferase
VAVQFHGSIILIGYTGFKNGALKKDGAAEVFYSVYHEYWGKGYGTEALRSMIKFGIQTSNGEGRNAV